MHAVGSTTNSRQSCSVIYGHAELPGRSEGFDVRIGVVVDELAAVLPHGVGRAPFGIFVVSDQYGEDVPAALQMLDVTSSMVAVIAGRRLKSAEHPTAHPMRRAFNIEAPGVSLAAQNLIAVGIEGGPLERRNRMLQILLALEEAYDETTWIREAFESGGAAQLPPDATAR
jgi:hypothetical protein